MITSRQLACVLVAAMAGCGHEFEPPDRSAKVAAAAAQYDPAVFDTVAWASDSLRSLVGNEVYAEKCRRCHGPLGRGRTDYALERGLEIPSLVESDWHLTSADSLRRTVFVGHEAGMPIYGNGGVAPREIDAVAFYILHTLRPEVLGDGAVR